MRLRGTGRKIVWCLVLLVGAITTFLAMSPRNRRLGQADSDATVEVGVTGGDLPYWRACEAIRHAEIKLAGQVQATQSLEGRATSMLGWSVAGLLALGAAVTGGVHLAAAIASGTCLFAAMVLCVYGIVRREFSGVPGYEPSILLDDRSRSEYDALRSLALGYQGAIDRNTASFKRFKRVLAIAIMLMVLAPISGLVVLVAASATPQTDHLWVTPVHAVSAWAECRPAPDFSVFEPYASPRTH